MMNMHEENHNYLKYNALSKEFDSIKNPIKRAKKKNNIRRLVKESYKLDNNELYYKYKKKIVIR